MLALGSNVGDRAAHLRSAVAELAAAGAVTGVSSVYETEPVGYLDQGPFYNMTIRLRTSLDPFDLLALAKRIEATRGRKRTFRNAPRTLDIDLLLYGDLIVDEPGLEIPHPRMGDRPFVLVPLAELAPEARDPVTGARYADLLDAHGAAGIVRVGSASDMLPPERGSG